MFNVDGRRRPAHGPRRSGGRCHDVGQTNDGLPAFLYLQPCPASVSADVGFDTAGPRNGAHHLIVRVLDAAGNARAGARPDRHRREPDRRQRPGLGGAPRARRAERHRRDDPGAPQRPLAPHLAQSSDERVLPPRDDRRPPHRPRAERRSPRRRSSCSRRRPSAGAASVGMKGTKTRADGSFTLTLPAHLSSRVLHLAYRARSGEARPAASASLRLAVRAPLSLAISPSSSRRGGTIHFRGRLAAGPIPRGGKPLILEARSGRGSWIQFHVVRTDRRGRYRAKYRFKFPGPAKLPVPSRVRSGSRLPVRDRCLARDPRHRALTRATRLPKPPGEIQVRRLMLPRASAPLPRPDAGVEAVSARLDGQRGRRREARAGRCRCNRAQGSWARPSRRRSRCCLCSRSPSTPAPRMQLRPSRSLLSTGPTTPRRTRRSASSVSPRARSPTCASAAHGPAPTVDICGPTRPPPARASSSTAVLAGRARRRRAPLSGRRAISAGSGTYFTVARLAHYHVEPVTSVQLQRARHANRASSPSRG